MFRLLLCSLLLAVCAACGGGEDRDHNLILETAPFYEAEAPYNTDAANAVQATVRSFAVRHDMEFLSADSLRAGEFNASANSSDLNISAAHVGEFGPVIRIYATARSAPTAEDRQLAAAFVDEVRGASTQIGSDPRAAESCILASTLGAQNETRVRQALTRELAQLALQDQNGLTASVFYGPDNPKFALTFSTNCDAARALADSAMSAVLSDPRNSDLQSEIRFVQTRWREIDARQFEAGDF